MQIFSHFQDINMGLLIKWFSGDKRRGQWLELCSAIML